MSIRRFIDSIVFALLVVITAAATKPVFGELITDPIETVARLGSTFAIVLGALTFMIATVGINIVADLVSPAFDSSDVAPQRISWRTGGMIAAVGSVLITPWNRYSSPQVIHYTLDTLGAFIGPLYGVLIADSYLVKKRRVVVDDLYALRPDGTYHYAGGSTGSWSPPPRWVPSWRCCWCSSARRTPRRSAGSSARPWRSWCTVAPVSPAAD
jgi:Cytosine/uracil/thiamine/allantoin permeases